MKKKENLENKEVNKKIKLSHRTIIHPNRWLIWAVIYILFIGLGLTSYIKITEISDAAEVSSEQVYKSSLNFSDVDLGFEFNYSPDYFIENENNIVYLFSEGNLFKPVLISKTNLSTEKQTRKGLNIISEKSVIINGNQAQELLNFNKTDNVIEKFIFIKRNGKLFTIRGIQEKVNQIMLTFKFIN